MMLWFLACAVPAVCDEMCARAADAETACLADRELAWPAVGFADRSDFLDHCDTWSWEEARLTGTSATEDTCAARRDQLDGTCASYEALAW